MLPASQGQEELNVPGPEHLDIEDLDLESQSQDATSPVRSGIEEVRRISKAFSVNPYLTRVVTLLQEDLTTQAVKAFLHSIGSLLYFQDYKEALNLVKSVYHPEKDPTLVYATEVIAISAVGSYCDRETHSMLLQKEFLDLFLHILSSPPMRVISAICGL